MTMVLTRSPSCSATFCGAVTRGAEAVRVFPAEEEEEDSATEMPPVSALEDAVASTTMRNGDFSVLTV